MTAAVAPPLGWIIDPETRLAQVARDALRDLLGLKPSQCEYEPGDFTVPPLCGDTYVAVVPFSGGGPAADSTLTVECGVNVTVVMRTTSLPRDRMRETNLPGITTGGYLRATLSGLCERVKQALHANEWVRERLEARLATDSAKAEGAGAVAAYTVATTLRLAGSGGVGVAGPARFAAQDVPGGSHVAGLERTLRFDGVKVFAGPVEFTEPSEW